jgi:hypothetical protein
VTRHRHSTYSSPQQRAPTLAALLAILLIVSGCNFPARAAISPTTIATEVTRPVVDTPGVPPSSTPLPPLTVLISPENDPTGGVLDPVLAGLSADSGFRFQHLSELPPDLAADKITIAVIAVGLPGLSPSPNLSVIEPLSDRLDDLAFLGGYTAALVSDDWRVASLSRPEGADGATTRIAFANGAEFLCGLCRTVRPPYPGFPVDYPSPSPGDAQTLQSTLAQIDQDDVEIAFLQPDTYDSSLVDGLAELGVRLIGVGPVGADPSPAWITTIEQDPTKAIESIWPAVSAGESRGSIQMPLRVTVIDPTRLTPGRLLRLQSVVGELELGYIGTGVDPLTGNPE